MCLLKKLDHPMRLLSLFPWTHHHKKQRVSIATTKITIINTIIKNIEYQLLQPKSQLFSEVRVRSTQDVDPDEFILGSFTLKKILAQSR